LLTFFKLSSPARLAVSATLLAVAVAGCTPADPGSTAQSSALGTATSSSAMPSVPDKSPSAKPADYRRLLLTAADLIDAEDTFTARSQTQDPNGVTGASAFFVNDKDNRAIIDTLSIYPDAATATATLHQSAATLSSKVTGGTPTPVSVGTDGVMITGTYPDEDKAVTLMSFTQGRALVRMEFQSATGDTTTDRFVTDVGKMQQIAVRIGLADSE
jgi:hypothetical protein